MKGSCYSAGSHSVGLWWVLRSFLSNNPLGLPMLLVPGLHFESQGSDLDFLSFGGPELFEIVMKTMDPEKSEPATFPLLLPHCSADDFKVVNPLKATQRLRFQKWLIDAHRT